MSRTLTFHPLVQKDLNEILAYYETEASVEIADRFEQELRAAILHQGEPTALSILPQSAALSTLQPSHVSPFDSLPGKWRVR